MGTSQSMRMPSRTSLVSPAIGSLSLKLLYSKCSLQSSIGRSSLKIGVAGTGRMGAAIAQRLMSVGHEVSVWNRSKDKTKPLAEAGAKVAGSAKELAGACELMISILTDDAAVAATYGGDSGLLEGEVEGKLFVEMSTVRPVSVEQRAARWKPT